MTELTLEKEIVKLEKYLKKQGRQDFIDTARGASQSTLDSKLLELTKHNQEIRSLMMRDDKLIDAKSRYKELGDTYREQLKMNAKLVRFMALLIKENES